MILIYTYLCEARGLPSHISKYSESNDIGNINLIQNYNTKVHVCDLDLRSSAALSYSYEPRSKSNLLSVSPTNRGYLK